MVSKIYEEFFIFPIPGNGRFIRQPLYVGDFCKVIISSLLDYKLVGVYEITGLEKITYISLMKLLRKTINAKTYMINLPNTIIWFFIKNLGSYHLQASFYKISIKSTYCWRSILNLDWPKIFKVEHTPIKKLLKLLLKIKSSQI